MDIFCGHHLTVLFLVWGVVSSVKTERSLISRFIFFPALLYRVNIVYICA